MKTLHELHAEKTAIDTAIRDADRASRKVQEDAWKTICANPDNWHWRVTVLKRETGPWTGCNNARVEVEKRVDPVILEAWKAGGVSTFGSDYQDGTWRGMAYGRTSEGILDSLGGGHVVIGVPRLCNDAQWHEFENGRIPAGFLTPISYL